MGHSLGDGPSPQGDGGRATAEKIQKIFLGVGGFFSDFFGVRGRVWRAPGRFGGVEDSAWSAKRPGFTRLWPGFGPKMYDHGPGFASQNPRFSDYVIQRRGWNCRFPAKFGMGFACRGGGGGFNAAGHPGTATSRAVAGGRGRSPARENAAARPRGDAGGLSSPRENAAARPRTPRSPRPPTARSRCADGEAGGDAGKPERGRQSGVRDLRSQASSLATLRSGEAPLRYEPTPPKQPHRLRRPEARASLPLKRVAGNACRRKSVRVPGIPWPEMPVAGISSEKVACPLFPLSPFSPRVGYGEAPTLLSVLAPLVDVVLVCVGTVPFAGGGCTMSGRSGLRGRTINCW